jgi:hypothetical protein
MKHKPLPENEPAPDLEMLLRQTSRRSSADCSSSDASRDAFLALGETLDAATADFDWRRMATRLAVETTEARDLTQLASKPSPVDHFEAPSRRSSLLWVSWASLAILLIGLGVGISAIPFESSRVASGHGAGAGAGEIGPAATRVVASRPVGIDGWTPISVRGDSVAPWIDELDVELANAQRTLRQGRDPWANDEPVLSDVFAQIGDLSAGLVLEPF